MSTFNQLRKERVIYHAGVILLVAWFGASGTLELTKNPLVWDRTLQMGYPPVLGFAKLLGVLVLLVPNKIAWLKEWVFAAFIFDVLFAAISGFALTGVVGIIAPSLAFILILTTYCMFRKINPALTVPFS